jgi:hypothetical protein
VIIGARLIDVQGYVQREASVIHVVVNICVMRRCLNSLSMSRFA